MKIKFNPKTMLQALKLAGNALQTTGVTPIYENFLITAAGNTCLIRAFDGQVAINTGLADIEAITEGVAVIQGKKLLGVCGALTTYDTVSLELKNSSALIKAGKGRYKIAVLNPEDYPVPPEITGEEFIMQTSDLMEMLSHNIHAMGKQDVRYYLNGILFEMNEGKIVCVATDGHRLALHRLAIESDAKVSVLIPNRGVMLLHKILSNAGDTVAVMANDKNIQFSCGNAVLTTTLINGKYPDYERVIPEAKGKVVADRHKLMEMLKRVYALSDQVGTKLTLSSNLLGVDSASTGNLDSGHDELDVEYSGEDMVFGVSATYFLDALEATRTPSVRLYFPGSEKAFRVEPTLGDDESQSNQLCTVMPMRL